MCIFAKDLRKDEKAFERKPFFVINVKTNNRLIQHMEFRKKAEELLQQLAAGEMTVAQCRDQLQALQVGADALPMEDAMLDLSRAGRKGFPETICLPGWTVFRKIALRQGGNNEEDQEKDHR